MFAFPNGNSLDLEFGVWAGMAYVKDATYRHDRESNCYPITEQKDYRLNPFPVIDELRVGLVYRLGRMPAVRKYNYRRDVDYPYDSTLTARATARLHYRDSVRNFEHDYLMIAGRFWHVYDSIAGLSNAKRSLKESDLQMPTEDDEKALKQKRKTEERMRRQQLRDLRRAARQAAGGDQPARKPKKKPKKGDTPPAETSQAADTATHRKEGAA